MVVDAPTGRGLRFSHALIRDSLYGDLASGERLRLHQRAVESLEELYRAEREPHLAELAYHAFEAAPGAMSTRRSTTRDRPATRPRRCSPMRRPLACTRWRSRRWSSRAPADEERCELLLALGDAQARGGDLPAAKETFVRAADLAEN